jgi:hypothetical protein
MRTLALKSAKLLLDLVWGGQIQAPGKQEPDRKLTAAAYGKIVWPYANEVRIKKALEVPPTNLICTVCAASRSIKMQVNRRLNFLRPFSALPSPQ